MDAQLWIPLIFLKDLAALIHCYVILSIFILPEHLDVIQF